MMQQEEQHNECLERALLALNGLALGDSFGQRFFVPENKLLIKKRELPPRYWSYTDDTAMAISLLETLKVHHEIDQDDLARRFARAFYADPNRAYGAGARQLLKQLSQGASWREESLKLFDGQGSMGNGAAMRVAPLGGYFADDEARLLEQSRLSAVVTHAHPEAVAGAMAVCLATRLSYMVRQGQRAGDPKSLIGEVIDQMPDGLTRLNLKQAQVMPAPDSVLLSEVTETLGNGSRILTYDTVPFCLWCAFHHLDDFESAMWLCAEAGGDVDTNAAIVGGIVAMHVGENGLPEDWLQARENLPINLKR